ncbi:hypothetical protein CRE_07975 [Caenorhabditis remanei]|uniref:F-box domain-containing protein n=1 Tax=Caenorhabditis remanei TaxID=31234 RepID=E3NW26_CAERE|nr:hypothetical protein CRE_07975 [Caenorhabditis remanei]
MDLPNPFPILRLPYLAIEEVFKSLHPIEIINLSLISKRAKAITKQMTFYSKYDICLRVDEGLGIAIRVENKLVSCTYLMTSDERMNGNVEEYGGNDYIVRRVYKYSKNPIEEWKQLFKYVLDILKKQTLHLLFITLDNFVNHNVSIIDFLRKNVKSVTECQLYQDEEDNDVDEHVAYLLNNLKVSNELQFYLNIKNDNFNLKIPKNLRQLYIHDSEWIGYERLVEIDCEHVTLRDNEITDEQWNLFLKKWMTMETNQNLNCLRLDNRELDEFRAIVLHDIPHEVVDRGVKRNLIFSYRDVKKAVNGGIDIRRIDGKIATFFVHDNVFSMSVH